MLTIYLYVSISNLFVLLDDGSSLYEQVKSIVSPDQFDPKCSWWIKQENLLCGKGRQFEPAFLFWSAVLIK